MKAFLKVRIVMETNTENKVTEPDVFLTELFISLTSAFFL